MRSARPVRFIVLAIGTTLVSCAHLDQPRSYLVYFDNDSATLTSDGQRIVATIVSTAHDVSPSKILVAGRADGATAHDATLADQRATTVMQALTQQGIPADRVEKQPDAPPSGLKGVAAHEVVVTLLP
ncbi:MAG TPA: OmpA family protein [Stellaceae bacterium]|nr:OmpA family protein [Stellaceae bacterium]